MALVVNLNDEEMALEWEELQAEDYSSTYEMTVEDLQPVYEQLVVCNRLLGIIVAFLLLSGICMAIRFFYRLITDNITNYF